VSSRPSWAAAVDRAPHPGPGRPPVTLVAAAGGTVVLAAAEAVHVAGREDLRPALRAALVVGIALQVPFAWLALRRSPAAAMVLLLCAVTAVAASLAAGSVAGSLLAAAVLVLLALSLRWFPTSEPWAS
jgi:hypothetical protein